MRITTFASGSGGNCALLSAGNTHILLDAGISLRRIRTALALQSLSVGDISAVFITHAHNDHIAGVRMLSKHCALPVYATPDTGAILRREMPEAIPCLREILPQEPVEMPGGLFVTAFSTMHDVPGSVGYIAENRGQRFGLCTDLGCVTDEVFDALCGVKAAVLEANHNVEMLRRGPYPYALKQRILSDHGHLSNETCGTLASELERAGMESLLLGHLSKENNRPSLALEAVRAMTSPALQISVAPPDGAVSIECGAELCLE